MIVNDGINEIALTHISANYTTVKIGNGADDTAASQTELDAFVASKVVTPSVIGSQLVWTAEFTGAEVGTQGVSELGIFKTSGDKLLSRVTFTNTGVIPSGDTITFTFRLELN